MEQKPKIIPVSMDNNIIVEGIEKVRVNLANCCHPIPGDDIVGYITKGNGISAHRKSCHNLDYMDNRMINIRWNEKTTGKFLTTIVIYSEFNSKTMMDIVQKASASNINIDSIKTVNKGDEFTYEVDLHVTGVEQLNKFMSELNNIKYIKNVVRFIK